MTARTGKVRFALLAVLGILVLAAVPAAFAGKGGGKPGGSGGGGSSSLTLVLLNSTDGVAHYGQQVTFNVSTTATSQPSVRLDCYQGGTKVYYSSAGFYPSYPWQWAQTFTLASGAWTGGAADCTATLYYFNGKSYPTLTTLSFHVEA